MDNPLAIPSWIRGKVSLSESFDEMKSSIEELKLNTVCTHASCPNKGECWENGHVTFMILGKNCTRGCKFCGVSSSTADAVDYSEPERISVLIEKFGIKYAVITSVTRDDLDDKGAGQFISAVSIIKDRNKDTFIELLIPDMNADTYLIKGIARSGADVIGHNIEIPRAMYKKIRPSSDYEKSLDVLRALNTYKGENAAVKSSMILGLGENSDEIEETFKDLKACGLDILYIGQYLNPYKDSWPVKKYYTREEFDGLRSKALEMGFTDVLSGPMVRSSYHAGETYKYWKTRA